MEAPPLPLRTGISPATSFLLVNSTELIQSGQISLKMFPTGTLVTRLAAGTIISVALCTFSFRTGRTVASLAGFLAQSLTVSFDFRLVGFAASESIRGNLDRPMSLSLRSVIVVPGKSDATYSARFSYGVCWCTFLVLLALRRGWSFLPASARSFSVQSGLSHHSFECPLA